MGTQSRMKRRCEIQVKVPTWLAEKLDQVAYLTGETRNRVAGSFFAAEVVHTHQHGKAASSNR